MVGKLVADWRNQPVRTVAVPERSSLGGGEVEIVVFGDYRSEPGKKLDSAIHHLLEEGRNVRYTFRHFPIDPECNANAARFAKTNPGSCDDALLVEATDVVHGSELRWALHRRLMAAGSGADRSVILAELGIDEAAVRDRIADDPTLTRRIEQDVAAKMATWRMHAPIVLVDGRFVPRWQHRRSHRRTCSPARRCRRRRPPPLQTRRGIETASGPAHA